jgi:hypothetical protein
LSARINLSIALSSSPLVADEIVGVDHAGHTSCLRGTAVGLVGAYYTAPALDDYAFFGSCHFRRQSDLELNRRSNVESGVRSDIHPGGAQVAGNSAVFSGLVRLVNLDR